MGQPKASGPRPAGTSHSGRVMVNHFREVSVHSLAKPARQTQSQSQRDGAGNPEEPDHVNSLISKR